MQLTTATAERLYADQRSKENYGDLIQFMTSAPVWLLVLSKVEAVTTWQYVLGPEDPMEARLAAPRRCVQGAAATAAGSSKQPEEQEPAAGLPATAGAAS